MIKKKYFVVVVDYLGKIFCLINVKLWTKEEKKKK
jgi:hypothetical protein